MNRIEPDANGMHIEWVLNNVCNYECSYCTPVLYGGSSGQPNYENSLNFFDYIHNNVNSNAKLLNLTGGEPTLWPKLLEFSQKLNPNYYLQITTNGSRTLRWWNNFSEKCTNLAKIAISVHLEYADLNHIIEVCKIVQEKSMTTVLLLAPPDKFELAKSFAETLVDNELKVSILIKPIRDRSGKGLDYTIEQQEYIKNFKYNKHSQVPLNGIPTHVYIDSVKKEYKYLPQLLSKNQHVFTGWKCNLGIDRLTIWYDGTVRGAQCSTAENNSYGNINDLDNLKIPKEATICETKFCSCLPDIRITKWKEHV